MIKKAVLASLMVCLVALPIMAKSKSNSVVKIQTSMGDVIVEIFEDKAPVSAKNFLDYVKQGFYKGTIFHRVIPDFMVQGGGFTPGIKQKQTMAPIVNEAKNGLKNLKGTLAMARTNVIDSATSQFFINTQDNAFLDFRSADASGYGYAVFGKVLEGMDIVEAMSRVKTQTVDYYENVPAEDIVIVSMDVLQKDPVVGRSKKSK